MKQKETLLCLRSSLNAHFPLPNLRTRALHDADLISLSNFRGYMSAGLALLLILYSICHFSLLSLTALLTFIAAKKKRRVVEWMSPLSFTDRQNDVLSRRCEGTGQWVLETAQASEWMRGPEKSSLWCSGIPGRREIPLRPFQSRFSASWYASGKRTPNSVYCRFTTICH